MSASKRGALQQLVEASVANDHSIWTKVCSILTCGSHSYFILFLIIFMYALFIS